MKISSIRTLCIEIDKAVAKLNPPFMQDVFKLKQITRSARNPNELHHHRQNQVTFGAKSLLSLTPPSNDPAETLPRRGSMMTRQENLFPRQI